jgi:hypothetical protein
LCKKAGCLHQSRRQAQGKQQVNNMSQQEQALFAQQTSTRTQVPVQPRPAFEGFFKQLIARARAVDSPEAWGQLAAHQQAFEQSSYADYLALRFDALLSSSPTLTRTKALGVRRVLEAVLDDVMQDVRRRGDAPADAETFNEWWDCVVGLVTLETRRLSSEPYRLDAPSSAALDDAGIELASWVQRLAGLGRLSVLRRAQLLAELLAACGECVDRPSDDADLVGCYQARARRSGMHVRSASARAALCDASTGDLLRLLVPQRCCALSKVSALPLDGHVAVSDYLGCWTALERISRPDLQLGNLGMQCVSTPDGQRFQRVSFSANGLPFDFDYQTDAGRLDEHIIDHLNRVALGLRLPGCFLVDRVNSDTDVDVIYLPLPGATALQLSGALNA